MLTRTEGIVLRTRKYGEADLIVTYLTTEKGIITAFARSPRKTKSRFGSSLEPLTHARISLWGKEQTSLPRITQSDIVNPFQSIRESFHDYVSISKMIEILMHLTPEGIPNKRLFSFVLNILHTIQSSDQVSREALHIITCIRLLATIGYAPRLSGCGRCGEKGLDFYPSSGTVLCGKCSPHHANSDHPPLKISGDTVHFYTHCTEWPIDKSNRLRPRQETLRELSALLDRHLTFLLSRKLRSSEFTASN